MTVNTQELRELVEKATPGPWTWKQVGTYSTPGVALFWPDSSKGGVHYRRLDSNGGMTEADADLITNAVRALPALLDENDALRAELQARQWQPIETAPNGVMILCADMNALEAKDWAFVAWLADGQLCGHRSDMPTHWMPLPPAPPQGETA